MVPVEFIIIVASLVTVLLGAAIAGLAFRAYRRTQIRPLWALGTGIGLITLGSAAGAVFYLVIGTCITQSMAIQSVAVMVGFGVLAYSVSMKDQITREG